MVDEGIREQLINEIRNLLDELEKRGVKREWFDFRRLKTDGLNELESSIRAQLKQRKKWLGEKL